MPADELADDRRVERRAALGDAAHGGGELVDVGDAVLEQIADALGARRRGDPSRSPARRTGRARARRSPGCARGSPWRRAAPRPSASAASGCRPPPRRACACATWRRRSSALPDCATTSKPASSSSRATPSRSSTESSARTTRTGVAPGRARERGEVAAEAGLVELEDPLGLRQLRQRPEAEVAELAVGGEHERSRLGGDDLAAVAGVARSGRRDGPRRRRSRPRRAPRRRCAARSGRAPASGQLWPASRRCASTAACAAVSGLDEDGEELVAARVDLVAVGSRDRFAQQPRGCRRALAASPRRARARAASSPRRRRRGR